MAVHSTRSSFVIRNYAEYFQSAFFVLALVVFATVVAILPLPTRAKLVVLVTLGLVPLVLLYGRSGDVFSPAGFLGLAYLMGWFGPVLSFTIHGDPDGLLLGNDLGYLVYPLVLSVVAIGCLVVGMHSMRADAIASKLPRFREGWNVKRADHVTITFAVIGSISLVLLIHTTGGIPTELSELSAKRQVPTAYITWGTHLLLVAALIDVGTLVSRDGYPPKRVVRAGALVGVGCFVPFYMSIRSILLLFMISLLIVVHYRVIRFTVARVLPFVPVAILVANLMGGLRRLSWMGPEGFDARNIFDPTAFLGFFDANPSGITVMAHLVQNVPERMEFEHGTTLLTWLVFPIPRSIWSDKPMNLGQVLGEEIYEQGVGVVGAGTPPPVPAELYLNFWIPGLVVGMYVLGVVVRAGYVYLRPSDGPLSHVLLYAVFAPIFVMGLLHGDFSPTMVSLLQWYIPLGIGLVYIVVGAPEPHHRSVATDS